MEVSLHLVHLPLDLPRLGRWAGERGLVRAGAYDEGFTLHKLLTESFGRGALQPFRLMPAAGGRSASLYAYAVRAAEALVAIAREVAPPEHLDVLDLGRLRAKPMPEAWSAGRRLAFDVRIRPVRRSDRDGDRRRAVERDAFLHEALALPPRTMQERGRTRERVYGEWLAEQLARDGSAALVGDARLARFRRHRAIRADGRRGPEGPDAVMHGELEIEEPQAFTRLLARGVGRHRAYGYGMLLLRPPGGAPDAR